MSGEVVKYNETRPYAPAGNLMFHTVTCVDINGNEQVFVCSSYQIKEQVYTFYDVRVPKNYFGTTKVEGHMQVWDKRYPNSTYIHGYLMSDTNETFMTIGYKDVTCRTMNRERVLDIDSFETCAKDVDAWYTRDSNLSNELSDIKIDKYNKSVLEDNRFQESTEIMQKAYDLWNTDEYERQVRDWKNKNFFIRMFTPKPVKKPLSKEKCCEFIRTVDRYVDDCDVEFDRTAMLEVFGGECDE